MSILWFTQPCHPSVISISKTFDKDMVLQIIIEMGIHWRLVYLYVVIRV